MKFHQNILKIAFISAALAVVLGAIGAHALKKTITPEALAIFETGVRFHFYHSIALAITGIVFYGLNASDCMVAARFFVMGIVCFSGSLYWLATLGTTVHFIVFITPMGGIFFIIGWAKLFIAAKNK